MFKSCTWLLAAIVLALNTFPTQAQCRNGQCSSPFQTQAQKRLAYYYPASCNCALGNCPDCDGPGCTCSTEWKAVPGQSQQAKYVNGVQVGSWDYVGGYWRPYDAVSKTWGPATETVPTGLPPVSAKPAAPAIVRGTIGQIAQDKPTGMDYWQTQSSDPRSSDDAKFTRNNKEITEDQAYMALGDPHSVPGDGGRPWLIYLNGDKGKRDAKDKEFLDSSEMAPWRQSWRMLTRDPKDASLIDRDGKPSQLADPAGGLWAMRADGGLYGMLDAADCEQIGDIAAALQKIDPQVERDGVRRLNQADPQEENGNDTVILASLVVGAMAVCGLCVFGMFGGPYVQPSAF